MTFLTHHKTPKQLDDQVEDQVNRILRRVPGAARLAAFEVSYMSLYHDAAAFLEAKSTRSLVSCWGIKHGYHLLEDEIDDLLNLLGFAVQPTQEELE